MERDHRLTGIFRGQTSNVEAPEGYERGHPWKVGHPVEAVVAIILPLINIVITRSRNGCREINPQENIVSPRFRIRSIGNTASLLYSQQYDHGCFLVPAKQGDVHRVRVTASNCCFYMRSLMSV